MRDGYRIIDADRHVMEPIELWQQYLEPGFRDQAPYHELRAPRGPLAARLARLGAKAMIPPPPTMMLDGEPVWQKISERAEVELAWSVHQRPAPLSRGGEPEAQLEEMDRTGIDLALLFPSFTGYLMGLDALSPARASAFARAYNTWLHDFCRLDPQRLRGVGVLARHDPAGMVEELERVAGFGWSAVVLRPNVIKGRLLSDPAYEPLWTACEERSIAVAIHEGAHARVPTAGADRFESHFAQIVCSHPLEQMLGLLALVEGGVLERHPALRVGFLEAGAGWLPFWLWRMDEYYEQLAGEIGDRVRRKPSEYFRRQCFIALSAGEPGLEDVVRCAGEDTLLFGTDFPHLEYDPGVVGRVVGLRSRLSEAVVRKILWDTPARFYGISAPSTT